MTETPPRGLGWTVAPTGRVLALLLAVVSLAVSFYVGWRQVRLVDCLKQQAVADQRRTAAIAGATDIERSADLALIKGGPDVAELRRSAIAARENTDRVRARYPAPPPEPCK